MMRSTMFALGAALLLSVASARAEDEGLPAESEVHVYVTDAKGAAVGGDQAAVTLFLDYTGFKKTLKMEAHSPKAAAKPEAKPEAKEEKEEERTHGGQVVTMDGYAIELAVEPVHAEAEEHGKAEPAKGEEKDEDHGADVPWFEVTL